jgi:hypothetical protein
MNLSNIRQPGGRKSPGYYLVSESGEGDWQIESPGSMAVKVFGRFLKNRDLRENVSPFPFPFFPSFFFLLLLLFFLFQFVKILRSSIFWRVAEIVENKFRYKNTKSKARKTLIKSRGEISAQIYFPIICLHMHTLLCGKKTSDHKPPDHKRNKKDKRNNKKTIDKQKTALYNSIINKR